MLIKYNGTSRLWMISITIDGNPVVWLGQDMMTGMRLLNRLAHDDCICAGGFVADKTTVANWAVNWIDPKYANPKERHDMFPEPEYYIRANKT